MRDGRTMFYIIGCGCVILVIGLSEEEGQIPVHISNRGMSKQQPILHYVHYVTYCHTRRRRVVAHLAQC